MLKHVKFDLTDGIFETGAYGVPSKSRNVMGVVGMFRPTRVRKLVTILNVINRI